MSAVFESGPGSLRAMTADDLDAVEEDIGNAGIVQQQADQTGDDQRPCLARGQ